MSDLIYLDHNATTPMDPEVLDSMLPWLTDRFWNASSSHAGGRQAADAVDEARALVADLVGARPGEVVWTSGATEADNLAIKGALEAAPSGRDRLITFSTEHKAVLDAAEWVASTGRPVTELPVHPDGTIDLAALEDALALNDVALVSVMAANNETGVITDLAGVADRAHAHGAMVHTDATQMIGREAFDIRELDVDLASMSGHKMYGPKGIGALFVSRRVRLQPITHGGGHERGMRSGTLNVPGIVGMGKAAAVAKQLLADEPAREAALRDRLVAELIARVSGIASSTAATQCLCNTASLRFVGADAEAVMVNAPDLAISSGSACTALVPAPSHVLLAMGMDSTAANECLRFSLGRGTRQADIDTAIEQIEVAVDRVRDLEGTHQ
jgi:cysteine desulfurase